MHGLPIGRASACQWEPDFDERSGAQRRYSMHDMPLTRSIWRNQGPLLKALALSALLAGGCESLNNTEKGVLAGGALGTGAGALIGAATHHAGAGAAIGAVVGGLSGGLIGNGMDNQER